MGRDLPRNVLGTALRPCCAASGEGPDEGPVTGFYRDGYCRTGQEDLGLHVVCAEVTESFLRFTTSRGNDLSTPVPEFGFPGLKPGDRWCLCVQRWQEAYEAGCAPPVVLEATHVLALEFVDLEALKAHAVGERSEG